nr:hypothetical protein [Candidatus Sigynarchaeota archaeon]
MTPGVFSPGDGGLGRSPGHRPALPTATRGRFCAMRRHAAPYEVTWRAWHGKAGGRWGARARRYVATTR